MSLRSGQAAQIGFVTEASFGVPITVTRFQPLVSESLNMSIDRIESAGIIAGRETLDSSQWYPGAIKVGGNIALEMYDRSQGLLWTHMLGGAAISGSGTYTQTYTPADTYGQSFTCQVGRPGTSGTVQPYVYAGCKIGQWELKAALDQIVTFGATVIAKAEFRYRTVADGVTTSGSAAISSATASWSPADIGMPISGTGIPALTRILNVTSSTAATMTANATADGTSITFTLGQALASASYPSGLVALRYTNGTATLGGTAVKLKEISLKGDNKVPARPFIGQYTTDEPIINDLREFSGTLTAEFTDNTLVNRYINGTETALVLTFTAGANTTTITMNVRYDGTTPNVAGRGILTQPLPFKAIGATTDASAITVVTINADSSA